MKRFSIVVLGGGLMLLVACDSKDTKKSARPVQQAMAPGIQGPATGPATAPAPKQQTPAPAPTQQPEKPDPVPGIIAEAEKAYEAGQADYKAGHLDAAKQDFNHAVDILMQGPVDDEVR